MRRWVALGLGLIALALAGCGSGGNGFVDGTVANSFAGSMHTGMSESAAESGLHGKPLDSLQYFAGGECVYYRGVRKTGTKSVIATGSYWQICFHQNKVATVFRTCPVGWRFNEHDTYTKAGYKLHVLDCRH
jgi:hypothetical protein